MAEQKAAPTGGDGMRPETKRSLGFCCGPTARGGSCACPHVGTWPSVHPSAPNLCWKSHILTSLRTQRGPTAPSGPRARSWSCGTQWPLVAFGGPMAPTQRPYNTQWHGDTQWPYGNLWHSVATWHPMAWWPYGHLWHHGTQWHLVAM